MRIRAVKSISALIAVIAYSAMLQPAYGQTDSSTPVSINSCGPMLDKTSQNSLFGIPLTSTSSGIQIVFTNESQKGADLINFAVNSNGDSFVIRDVGTFSPGIEITHRYRNGEGQAFVLPQFVAPKLSCAVQSVHFIDGSSWRPGEAVAQTTSAAQPNRLSATPSNVQIARNAEARLFMVSSSDEVAAFSERNSCAGIATVTLATTGEAAAAYTVKPLSAGSCAATISDEAGNRVTVAINVR
ncbi:MAG: hypothetical protein M3R51_08910 [Candidatus Eremiobacteraeota bacterium]|nr:hypothetical protein [Candidatus Eremiobacteraeota bacterium]